MAKIPQFGMRIDPALHHRFKTFCVLRGISMRAFVEQCLDEGMRATQRKEEAAAQPAAPSAR